MSSVILGETRSSVVAASSPGIERSAALDKNVNNHFDRTAAFRYAGFIYNASDSGVSVDVKLLQNGIAVFTGIPNFVTLDAKDSTRLPFIGEIDLSKLAPGIYELKITAEDKNTRNSSVRRVNVNIY